MRAKTSILSSSKRHIYTHKHSEICIRRRTDKYIVDSPSSDDLYFLIFFFVKETDSGHSNVPQYRSIVIIIVLFSRRRHRRHWRYFIFLLYASEETKKYTTSHRIVSPQKFLCIFLHRAFRFKLQNSTVRLCICMYMYVIPMVRPYGRSSAHPHQ